MQDRSLSPLQAERQRYAPKVPPALMSAGPTWEGAAAASQVDPTIASQFPHTAELLQIRCTSGTLAPAGQRVGVVLSGGQAPGGHNVMTGLYDALSAHGGELTG
ncbi:MAG: diphosphate--fructose-6-phosphate 1-phosphotransferase, partial [Acidobacteriota bacterium]|nr:diphosphate--fructose-6-phosphate 1-phosphotransferase [Acidobacteriota bacterium]